MKGKLIKVEDGYNLFIEQPQGRLLEATCSISEIKRLEENNVSFKKLSLKNCEAVVNGYDLDELIEESYEKHRVNDKDYSINEQIQRSGGFSIGYEEGFQKSFELLGDKKFSEEDVISMIEKSRITALSAKYLVLSLQQTEFDVEVEQELIQSSIEGEAIWKTKLDVDGCLILRRI